LTRITLERDKGCHGTLLWRELEQEYKGQGSYYERRSSHMRPSHDICKGREQWYSFVQIGCFFNVHPNIGRPDSTELEDPTDDKMDDIHSDLEEDIEDDEVEIVELEHYSEEENGGSKGKERAMDDIV
jgi:hypothetical protein